jgi:hypothetical protein
LALSLSCHLSHSTWELLMLQAISAWR